MRKSFKRLSELKVKFIPKARRLEAMVTRTPLKVVCSNRDSNSTFILFFLFKPGLVA